MSSPHWKVAKDKGTMEWVGQPFNLLRAKGFMNPSLDLVCVSAFFFDLFCKTQLLFPREGQQQSRDDLEQIHQACRPD